MNSARRNTPWTGIIPEIPEIPPIEIPVKFKKEEGDGLSPDVANGVDVPVGADTSQFDAAMNGLENSTAGTTVPAPELDMSKWDAAVNENLAALTNAAQGTELDFGEPDTSGLDEAEKAAEDVKAKLDALGDITLPDTSGMSGDLDSLNNAITDAESNIKNLETTFSGLDLTSAGTNAGNTFTAGLQGADPTGAASELAASVSSSVESKVGGAFTTAGTNAANQFGTSLQTTAAGITLNAEGATIAGTLTEGMNEGMPAAVESMTTTGEQIRAAAQAVNLSAQGRHMLQTLTQGMNSGRGAAVASARATGNAIRSAFASINLYSTGVNIMRGLLNGMKSMFNTLMAEAKRMAAELKKTIQSGMEVASPSKFTTWVGEMTGQGLINGIENMTAKAAAAAANMTAGMRDAMAPTNNAATPRAASQSPYDALGGSGGENRNNSSEGNSGERRIVIDETGSGQIEVTGMTRESAAEMIANQIKPKLMEILSREIYTGGVGTYEY